MNTHYGAPPAPVRKPSIATTILCRLALAVVSCAGGSLLVQAQNESYTLAGAGINYTIPNPATDPTAHKYKQNAGYIIPTGITNPTISARNVEMPLEVIALRDEKPGRAYFDPLSPVVDLTANTITLPTPLDTQVFVTGRAVIYDKNGGTEIGGLLSGQIYWLKLNGNQATLHTSRADALSGNSPMNLQGYGSGTNKHVLYRPSGILSDTMVKIIPEIALSAATDLITVTNHGFQNGDAVNYTYPSYIPGSQPPVLTTKIVELSNGGTYYVTVYSADAFYLYTDTARTLRIDFVNPHPGTQGVVHELRYRKQYFPFQSNVDSIFSGGVVKGDVPLSRNLDSYSPLSGYTNVSAFSIRGSRSTVEGIRADESWDGIKIGTYTADQGLRVRCGYNYLDDTQVGAGVPWATTYDKKSYQLAGASEMMVPPNTFPSGYNYLVQGTGATVIRGWVQGTNPPNSTSRAYWSNATTLTINVNVPVLTAAKPGVLGLYFWDDAGGRVQTVTVDGEVLPTVSGFTGGGKWAICLLTPTNTADGVVQVVVTKTGTGSAVISEIKVQTEVAPGGADCMVRDSWFSNLADDGIEADALPKLTVDDVLIDGSFVGISASLGDQTVKPNFSDSRPLTLNKALMRLGKVAHGSPSHVNFPHHGGWYHLAPYKFTTDSGKVIAKDTVFAFEDDNDETMEYLWSGFWSKFKDLETSPTGSCQNVQLLYLAGDQLPAAMRVPKTLSGADAVTIKTGQAARTEWNNLRQDWLARHADINKLTTDITTTPLPTVTLTASAPSVASGTPVTLKWTTTNATLTTPSGEGFVTNGILNDTAVGDVVTPYRDTTYTLLASGPGGLSAASVTVTMTGGPNIDLGLVARYTFDTADIDWGQTSAEIRDSSGYVPAHHGDFQGSSAGATVPDGVSGHAIHLQGPTIYAPIVDSERVSVSFWVRVPNNQTSVDFFQLQSVSGAPVSGYSLKGGMYGTADSPNVPGTLWSNLYPNAGANRLLSSNGPVMPANTWVHLAYVADGYRYTLYVGGKAWDQAQYNENNIKPTNYLWLFGNGSRDIDELRVYNRTLSDLEILQLASNGINYSTGFTLGNVALNGNTPPTIVNGRLRLTPNANDVRASAYHTNRVDVSQFATSFKFQVGAGSSTKGEGFTFVLHNNALTALNGGSAGLLGYGGSDFDKSVAVRFEFNGASSTGHYKNGNFVSPAVDLTSYFDFDNGHEFEARISYDVATLTLNVVIEDMTTHVTHTQNYTNLNIPTLIGSADAYAGFTAATGGPTNYKAQQEIINWVFSNPP